MTYYEENKERILAYQNGYNKRSRKRIKDSDFPCPWAKEGCLHVSKTKEEHREHIEEHCRIARM